MESGEPQNPLPRVVAILLASIAGGFTIGIFLYRHWASDQRAISNAGFDVSQPEPAQEPQTCAIPAEEAGPPASSLSMVKAGPMKASMASSKPNVPPAQALTALIRRNESRYESLARRYTRNYPVIREYGRDWASYPDLRRYNLEYLRDRDPIRFAFNVAASRNFSLLVGKYAARPEILQFIQDTIKKTPGELVNASAEYLKKDRHAYELLKRFAHAAGLPDAMVTGLASGSVSPNQARSALKTDPRLREFLQQGNVAPNQLNSDFQNPR